MRSLKMLVSCLAFAGLALPCVAQNAAPSVLLDTMSTELNRAMTSLKQSGTADQPAPYFLSYDAHDITMYSIAAQQGGILGSNENRSRTVDISVRVGDTKLDNTHGEHHASGINTVSLPLNEDRAALARALWWGTNREYGRALETYLQVKTDTAVHAQEEDTSPDFSHQDAVHAAENPVAPPPFDSAAWQQRLRSASMIFRQYPHLTVNLIAMVASNENNYLVSSEGSRLSYPHQLTRILILAAAKADDGMDLYLARTFEGRTPADMPPQPELEAQVHAMGDQLEKLRNAPAAVPFDGPAILSGRAAAVFFHEVLGHRLEGQRQRGDQEGETFTKDVGKPILPSFLSVVDDPTLASYDGVYLSGHYIYDDEGEPAQKVPLIQDGVLKQFLMSRMPIANFSTSNGHGRAQPGLMPTGRQGNLIVTSTRAVPEKQLRQMLIDEIKKQNKPYGLYFEDIASGFTLTQRVSPQAFQVIPLVVYRVYADGRPDELVRGVNIVGTPQAALTRIVATGDQPGIFNGECGAESGSIPVSAISPAMLVSEIETQKAAQDQSRPPILPPPGTESGKEEK